MLRKIGIAVTILAVTFITANTLAAQDNWKTWVDPDSGRTQEEADAVHEAAIDDFFDRLPGWIEKTAPTITDYSALPRAALNDRVPPSDLTFEATIEASDAVIDGTVVGVAFRPSLDTVVTLDVRKGLFGKVDEGTIQVIFPGGIMPYPDWDHAILSYSDSAPIPDVGSRVVLFLNESDEPLRFTVRKWTGVLFVEAGGSLEPLEANPWAEAVHGTSVQSLVGAIAEAS